MTESQVRNIPNEREISPAERPLWKRARGLIRTSLDQSKLTLIGGNNNGREMNSSFLMTALNPTAFSPTNNPLTPEAVTRASLFADVVLGNRGKQPKANYINGIGGNDVHNLPQIAVDFGADGADESGIAFRIVYGATEKIPLRVLSYPLPVLLMMEEMRRLGVTPPELQIVFASNVSSAINGLSKEKVDQQKQLYVDAQRLYLAQFFPDLNKEGRVLFLEDTPIESGSTVVDVLKSTLRAVNYIQPETMEQLLRKGSSDVSVRDKKRYAALHPVFHDAMPEGLLRPLITDQREYLQPTTIISVGGVKETDFYDIRSQIRDQIKGTIPLARTLQLLTRHGVPPYYMAEGGDVSLEAMEKGRDIADLAEDDLKYLGRVSSQRGDFGGFIGELQRMGVAV